MRNEQKNYLIAGTFVIAMIVALVLWLSILSGRSGPIEMYKIQFKNVMGLSVGTQIFYSGYPLGYIDTIDPLLTDEGQLFELNVAVEKGWKIPDNSVAAIGSSGLLSALVVNVKPGDSSEYLSPGSIITSVESGDVMASISSVAEELKYTLSLLEPTLVAVGEQAPVILQNANQSVANLNQILSQENSDSIRVIVQNLESTTTNASTLSGDLLKTNEELQQLLARADGMLEKNDPAISEAIQNLEYSLQSVSENIDSIVANLDSASHNMKDFSRQIRQNPSVILLGRNEEDKGKE